MASAEFLSVHSGEQARAGPEPANFAQWLLDGPTLGQPVKWSGALALALLAGILAVGLRAQPGLGSGIWHAHVSDGQALWSGVAPDEPGFPMWGYDWLAAPLGEAVVAVQIALLLGAFAWWLLPLVGSAAKRRGVATWLSNPALLMVLLAPWIWLVSSYYSNALSAVLVWLGTWMLLESMRRDRHLAFFAGAGGLLGLAANVRTEHLLLVGLLALGLCACEAARGAWRTGALRAATLLASSLLTMLPWVVYTQQTLGTARLTSTNGGGVMYLGLGVLPGNPWGVRADDPFVHEIALAEVGTRAWSAPANDLLQERFREAVAAHPAAFARRVARGWRLALTQGVFVPPIEQLVEMSERDVELADYLNERAKGALGLAVNRRELAEYEAEGLSLEDVAPLHYALVVGEYATRGAFAVMFLALLLASGVAVWRLGPKEPITWVWLAYVGSWLFTAGFVQTLPRHTTLIVPVLVTAVAWGAARWSDGQRSVP